MPDFLLEGLSCEKCVARVRAALEPLGVPCHVSLNPPRLSTSGDLTLDQINLALSSAGAYRATPIATAQTITATPPWHKTYRALLLVLLYSGTLATLFSSSLHSWMNYFMGGYFLGFALFKLLDVNAFATAFARYNPLAARSRAFALAYPFIELAFGFAYLSGTGLMVVNIVVALLLSLNFYGVVCARQRGQVLQCACLGTAIAVPIGRVTMAEDAAMVLMALFMIMVPH